MDASSLSQICAWTDGSLASGDPSGLVTRVNTDSRVSAPGDLFVALRGEKFDAHDFLPQVAAAGATAALVDRDVPPFAGMALIRVEDALAALQRLAGAYRAALPLRVTAITGSNGKTSTKDFTAAVLSQKFRVLKTAGNLNNHIGVPLTLLRASREDECAVIELGMNHPGEIAPLAALAQPQMAVITNIGTAHIEYMGTREAIALEKGRLLEALPGEGIAVLGADCEFADALAARTPARKIWTGIDAGEVRALDVRDEADGSRFFLAAGGERAEVHLPVPGRHMVRNALLAAAVGWAHGLTLAECARGLAATALTKGRVEQKQIRGLNVIDDSYNANPDSVIAALQTIAHLPSPGRRFAVLGRMGELGSEAENGHRAVGTAAAREKIGCVISVGGEAEWISEAARAGGVAETFHTEDIGEAVRLLKQLTRAGDVVLVKGSRSARMERIVEELAR